MTIENGCRITGVDEHGRSPLHIAAGTKYDAAVSLLISTGADVDARANDGGTPASTAAERNADSTLKLLLLAGADRFAVNAAGEGLLEVAVKSNSAAAVRILSDYDEIQTDELRTGIVLGKSLTAGAQNEHVQCVTALMCSRFWKARSQEDSELLATTMLHVAADVPTIEAILTGIRDTPAAIQSKLPSDESSLLHSAVAARRPVQMIRKLLKLGADPLAKDRSGQTPAEYARLKGQTLIAQLLDRAAQDTQAKVGRASSSTTA